MLPSDSILEEVLQAGPYSYSREEKRDLLVRRLRELTAHHYENCAEYRKIVDSVFGGQQALEFTELEDAPYVPVSIFKQLELRSIPAESVYKVLSSSGTTGQTVSRIVLDRETAALQQKVLVKTMQNFLGKSRLPMIIVDHPNVIGDRKSFSARGAGILGMSQFGRKPLYALDSEMNLQLDSILNYIEEHQGSRIFLFGFTFMVWKYLAIALKQRGVSLPLKDAVLIHSGGWKKLIDMAVSPEEFRGTLREVAGIGEVINFYGMVEQVGSLFFENPKAYLQSSVFSEILIRDPLTLKPLPAGEMGLIQVVSMLPYSYPGHSILTEDLGVWHGECIDEEMKGRYFSIDGRVPQAEIRGCSDTFSAGT